MGKDRRKTPKPKQETKQNIFEVANLGYGHSAQGGDKNLGKKIKKEKSS